MGADAAVHSLGHINVLNLAKVAGNVQAGVVIILFVSAANQVVDAFQRTVEDHGYIFRNTHRADEAGYNGAIHIDHSGMDVLADQILYFSFIGFHIAANEYNHKAVIVVALVNHCLTQGLHGTIQEAGQVFNGLYAGGVYLGEFCNGQLVLVLHNYISRFHVGAVATLGTDHDGVLANGGQHHELVGHAATHHTGVCCYSDYFGHTGAGVNTLISAQATCIILLQILLRGMEGICILHGELAHADQTGTGTGLVAELGLDLIDHKGIFIIAVGKLTHQLYAGLFVGHAQYHGCIITIGKTHQSAVHCLETATLFPQGAGQNHREHYFLAVHHVHLLADDLLDLLGDALSRGVQRENTVGYGLNIATAHHQRMAVYHTIGRTLFKTLAH